MKHAQCHPHSQAVKQGQISKQLMDLQIIWKDLNFEFEIQEDQDFPTFKIPEDLLMVVEEHQVSALCVCVCLSGCLLFFERGLVPPLVTMMNRCT